jgi:hypothetical protein
MNVDAELIQALGQHGENRFADWLNNQGLGYVYVSQARETFATLFHDAVKRPDFMVLLDSIGVLAVDVKNYKASFGELTLGWDTEITKVLTFERVFRLPVWYAYLQEVDGNEVWYWISALKAVEVGDRRRNEKTQQDFLAIKLEHFAHIATGDDLGKLFTQRMPGYKAIQAIAAQSL